MTNSIEVAGYALMDDTQAMLLSGNVKAGMDHLCLGMRKIRDLYLTTEWREFAQATFLDHPITQLIHQCPFTYHSFTKPRGYAGDAELLDFIYGIKQPPQDLAPLGREIFNYTTKISACSSVRSRRDVIAKTIDDVASAATHPVQILSIACGHLREAKESAAVLAITRWSGREKV